MKPTHEELVDASYGWLREMMRSSDPMASLRLQFIHDEILRCRIALEEIVASRKSNWCERHARKALEGRDA